MVTGGVDTQAPARKSVDSKGPPSGEVILFDSEKGQMVQKLTGHAKRVTSVCLHGTKALKLSESPSVVAGCGRLRLARLHRQGCLGDRFRWAFSRCGPALAATGPAPIAAAPRCASTRPRRSQPYAQSHDVSYVAGDGDFDPPLGRLLPERRAGQELGDARPHHGPLREAPGGFGDQPRPSLSAF